MKLNVYPWYVAGHRLPFLLPTIFTTIYTLDVKKEHTYLGIKLHNKSWKHHIQCVVSKATKLLNFTKHTLYKCNSIVKEASYNTLVRPLLEYASIAWDPYQQYIPDWVNWKNTQLKEYRASRWVTGDYRMMSSVTAMLSELA